MTESNTRAYAIAAELPSADALLLAAEKIRDAGVRRWDVYSPYPIRGMDRAMGLNSSSLGKLAFFGGLAGFLAAGALQFGTTSFLYPLDAGGKPNGLATIPALFPILFEMTILFAAFTAVIGMLVMNRLPRLNHPLFSWERFRAATDDSFFVAIELIGAEPCEQDLRDLLSSAGGTNITTIYDEP